MAGKTPELKVKIVLDGVSQFQTQMRAVGKAAVDLGGDFKNLGTALGDSAKQFAKVGIAIAGVATALVAMTAKHAEAAEQVQNLSKVSGNSVATLQVFQKIAEDAGLSGESAGKGLVKLTKNMQELKDPTSATSKELNSLAPGLRQSLLSATSADERFQILRGTLSATSDETKAVNIAQLLLGKSGAELLPVLQLTGQEYAKQEENLKRLNFVLTETQTEALAKFDDAFDNAGTVVSSFGKQLSAELAPQLTVLANAFTDFVARVGPQALGAISLFISEATDVVRDFFILLSQGPEVQGVDDRARILYDRFIQIRDAIQGAFATAIPIFQGFMAALDPIAKLLGFNSALQLGITAAILNFLGVFKIATAAFSVGTGIINLFFTTLGLGPPALALLSSAFAAAGAFIGNIIFQLQFGWLLALEKMGAAAGIFSGLLTTLRTVATAMWVALTGPIGLAVIAFAAVGAAIAFIIEKTIGWKNILEGIKTVFSGLVSFVTGTVLPALGAALIAAATAIGNTLRSLFGGLLTSLGALLASIGGLIVALGQRVFNEIAGFISGAVQAVVAGITNVITSVFNVVKNAITSSLSFVTGLIDRATNAVNALAAKVKGTTSTAPTAGGNIQGPPRPPGFAVGGLFRGAGSSTSDSNVIAVSDNEFILRAAAVRKYGVGFLNALNMGMIGLQGFAMGGLVGDVSAPLLPAAAIAEASRSSGGRPLQLVMPGGERIDTTVDEDTAKKLQRSLRRSGVAKSSKLPGWYK